MSLFSLIAFGPQDEFLTANPNITFFKTTYSKTTIEKYILNEKTEDCCAFCLEQYSIGDTLHKTTCNHIFHYDCLSKYLDYLQTLNYQCPCCRQPN